MCSGEVSAENGHRRRSGDARLSRRRRYRERAELLLSVAVRDSSHGRHRNGQGRVVVGHALAGVIELEEPQSVASQLVDVRVTAFQQEQPAVTHAQQWQVR